MLESSQQLRERALMPPGRCNPCAYPARCGCQRTTSAAPTHHSGLLRLALLGHCEHTHELRLLHLRHLSLQQQQPGVGWERRGGGGGRQASLSTCAAGMGMHRQQAEQRASRPGMVREACYPLCTFPPETRSRQPRPRHAQSPTCSLSLLRICASRAACRSACIAAARAAVAASRARHSLSLASCTSRGDTAGERRSAWAWLLGPAACCWLVL